MSRYLRPLSVVSALCSVALCTPAIAQIEEIFVTAQKREESLQDVPIAVNALTGAMFDQFDVARTDDLERVFANLGTNRNSAANTGFSIRGVGTDNVHLSGQQSVGTYLDDVSMVSPFVGTIAVYDIERVEVLRGPQNTLYGRNTTGGAVVWHTNQATPGEGANGYTRFRLGNGGLARFEAAAGFDFNDQLAGRVAVMKDTFDGVWRNVIDGSATGGAYDRHGVRFNLGWNAGDNTSVSMTVSSGKSEGEDTAVRASGNRLANGLIDPEFNNRRGDQQTGVDNFYVRATAADVAAYPYLQEQFDLGTGMVIVNPDPGAGVFNRLVNYSAPMGWTYQDPEDGYNSKWNGVRLSVDHDFDNMTLTAITSYDETATREKNGSELTGFTPMREGNWNTWQHEIRLTSTSEGYLRWLAGAYYTSSESEEDTWVANIGAGPGLVGIVPGIDIDSTYKALSGYAQGDIAVTDSLTLSAGLRFTKDELSAGNGGWVRRVCGTFPSSVGTYDQDRDYRAAGCPGAVPGQIGGVITDSPEQKLSELGWKVGADYKFLNGGMLWTSASRGFKGGAYDNRALSTGGVPIGPEYLTAYEVGYKGRFLDNTLELNTSYYSYDWEDLQLFESYGGIPATVNVPGVEIKGFELEVKWAPNANWYFQGSAGTADSKVVDVAGLNPASLATIGKRITRTPRYTGNLLSAYSFPVADGELELSVNYRYQSPMYYTFVQNINRDRSSPYKFVDARANLTFGAEEQYTAALWVNNLTEEFTCTGMIYGPGAALGNYSCGVGAYGERLFGLTLEANF